MHLDGGYVTGWDLKNGMAAGHPLLWDCGTRVMDQPLADAILRYVDQGGTFVACADTGRNSPTVPEAWPISQLTGYRVRTTDERGQVTFSQSLPVVSGLSGVRFPSSDTQGISLEASNPSCQTLATWQDGTTAIGFRQVGRGRIIVIGAHDLPKSGFALNQPAPGGGVDSDRITAVLMEGLGAARTSYCANASVWTRRQVSKNGLMDELVAFNSQNSGASADVLVKVKAKPETVVDLETGAKVGFSYTDDGWVHIHGISFEPLGTHVFGVSRGTMLEGVHVWWEEKLRYWQEKTRPVPLAFDPPSSDVIQLKDWKFTTDADEHVAADPNSKLQQFDDSNWKPMSNGPWKTLTADLKNFKGSSFYRSTFNVTPSWDGHEVDLNLYTFDTPVAFGQAKFYIDGKQVATYNKPEFGTSRNLVFDVSSVAKPGMHQLSVSVAHAPEVDNIAGPFLSGAVWLSAAPRFVEEVDLSGNWDAIGDDWITVQPFAVPGRGDVKYIRKTASIPAGWQGKSVFLRVVAQVPASTIMINGVLLDKNLYLHQFGSAAILNISPYIRPGADNTIELWPVQSALNRMNETANQHGTLQITKIQLGLVDPSDLPIQQ